MIAVKSITRKISYLMYASVHNTPLCGKSDSTAIILLIPTNSSESSVRDRAEQVILKSLFENRPMHLTMPTTFRSKRPEKPALAGKSFVYRDEDTIHKYSFHNQ